MKKQWIALLTGCVLVCSMLAGCGSKPQTSAPAATGSDKGCTDEAILSQLKNDGTPEFVLDGTYYTLPLETSQLIQAGWSLETEEYDAAEVSLQPGERIYGELSKDDQEIDVAIVNAGTEPCKPAEGGTVVELEYSADKDQPNPDFFVTLNGINCAMSNAALQKALEGVDGYELNSAGNNRHQSYCLMMMKLLFIKSFWTMTTQQSRLLRTMFFVIQGLSAARGKRTGI